MAAFSSFVQQLLTLPTPIPRITMQNDQVPAGSQRDAVNVAGAEEGDAGAEQGDAAAGAPAPPPGGSSSSGADPSSETSACEQQLPRRNKKRKLSDGDKMTFEYSAIADAIHQFREAYVMIETTKIESKKKVIAHETKMATMTLEMEERRYKCMMETQLATAKIIAEAVKGAFDKCLDSRGA